MASVTWSSSQVSFGLDMTGDSEVWVIATKPVINVGGHTGWQGCVPWHTVWVYPICFLQRTGFHDFVGRLDTLFWKLEISKASAYIETCVYLFQGYSLRWKQWSRKQEWQKSSLSKRNITVVLGHRASAKEFAHLLMPAQNNQPI